MTFMSSVILSILKLTFYVQNIWNFCNLQFYTEKINNTNTHVYEDFDFIIETLKKKPRRVANRITIMFWSLMYKY